MTSPTRAPGGRRGRRGPLQVAAGVVAFVAVVGSVVVAFTNDARFLKLALVAVLWVAVGALFFVEQMRRRAETAVARTADLRAVYELELEREVRARRKHELATEREVRERVSAEVRNEGRIELDELRDELKALRENLSLLLSGDLLVERVALRAEATRVRSLTETVRLESGGTGRPERTPDGSDPLEAETVEHASEPVAEVGPAPTRGRDKRTELVGALQVPGTGPEPATIPSGAGPEPATIPSGAGPEPATIPSGAHESAPPRVDLDPAPPRVYVDPAPPLVDPAPPLVDVEPAADEPDSGAHSSGRSVSELIAAYGGGTGRRRRAED